jgi:hypothetical protein
MDAADLPSQDVLDDERELRLKERQMWSLCGDLMSCIFFAIVVSIVAMGGRNPQAYHYQSSLVFHWNGDWCDATAITLRPNACPKTFMRVRNTSSTRPYLAPPR